MRQVKNGRFILGFLFLILGAVCLYDSFTSKFIFSTDALGPMDYPRFLLYAWLVLVVIYIVIPRSPLDITQLLVASPVLLKTIGNAIVFVILLPRVGFICSSFLFMSVMFYQLGDRNYRKIGLISITSVIVLWAIFEFILQTPLPLGFWEEVLHQS